VTVGPPRGCERSLLGARRCTEEPEDVASEPLGPTLVDAQADLSTTQPQAERIPAAVEAVVSTSPPGELLIGRSIHASTESHRGDDVSGLVDPVAAASADMGIVIDTTRR
jgi:hypothetical protein